MAKIKVLALGGLDEIHKNLYIIEIESMMFILDAGTYQPLSSNFGIQHFIPRLDYIKDNQDKVKGLFISSADVLEFGAIKEIIKIIPKIKIYASKETIYFLTLVYEKINHFSTHFDTSISQCKRAFKTYNTLL